MKILVIKTSSMGDIIHTLPALTDVAKKHNGVFFDWVVEENFAEIPRWHQNVDKVIPVAIRRWRQDPVKAFKNHEIQNFIKNLRSEKYDLIIDAQGLIKSAIITLLAKGKTWHAKYGYSFNSAREPIVSLFYEKKIAVSKNQHAIIRIRELFAKIFNYPKPLDFPDYGINIHSESKNSEQKYLVFIHGASRQYKLWTEQKWVDLAKKATAQNFLVKLPWGNETEKNAAERIAHTAKVGVEVLPKLSLSEIASVLGNSYGVIGLDTGLAHLAAALGIPVIALYGETKSNLIGVFGKKQKHIENFRDVEADDVWKEFLDLIQN